jgi:hypothetical protein
MDEMLPLRTHEAEGVLRAYCRAIDSHDRGALKEVFSADATLRVGEQRWEGRDGVMDNLASLFSERQWARHLVSNVQVTNRGDGALEVESYFQFFIQGESLTTGVGDYRAVLAGDGGLMRIQDLEVSILTAWETKPG